MRRVHYVTFGNIKFSVFAIFFLLYLVIVILFDWKILTKCNVEAMPIYCSFFGELREDFIPQPTKWMSVRQYYFMPFVHHVLFFFVPYFILRIKIFKNQQENARLWKWWHYLLIFLMFFLYEYFYQAIFSNALVGSKVVYFSIFQYF